MEEITIENYKFFIENYNTDSKEYDVLNYWPSKSATDEKYKKLTMFLIKNGAYADITDAFVHMIINDADKSIINYMINTIAANISSISIIQFQSMYYACIDKRKMNYASNLVRIMMRHNPENIIIEIPQLISSYCKYNDSLFGYFIKCIYPRQKCGSEVNYDLLLNGDIIEDDKIIWKLIHSDIYWASSCLRSWYINNKKCDEGLITKLSLTYNLDVNKILTVETRDRRIQQLEYLRRN